MSGFSKGSLTGSCGDLLSRLRRIPLRVFHGKGSIVFKA